MDNSPRLPYASIFLAAISAVVAAFSYYRRGGNEDDVFSLNEVEIGLTALSVTLVIFAVQGLISVISEGRELVPGHVAPRLTNLLSLAIVLASVALFADAILLAIGLVSDWDVWQIGWLAGIGCFLLALVLVFYKEAFVGDEAHLDERNDGIPW